MAQGNERKSKLLGSGDIVVSFEFFPPKTEKMEETLWSSISRLAPLRPEFVSVTYGAGGSTRERTHATVTRLLRETDLKPAAHLTCVDASKEEVDAVAEHTGTRAFAISWRCAATRLRAQARSTNRIRADIPMPPISSPD